MRARCETGSEKRPDASVQSQKNKRHTCTYTNSGPSIMRFTNSTAHIQTRAHTKRRSRKLVTRQARLLFANVTGWRRRLVSDRRARSCSR